MSKKEPQAADIAEEALLTARGLSEALPHMQRYDDEIVGV